MIRGLDHVQLAMPRGAEGAARAFWIGLVGMSEIEKPATLAGRGGLWLRAGAAELHLGVEDPFAPARKAHPCLVHDSLDELAERLSENGHAPHWDDAIRGRRRFFCEDPFGNRIEFMAPDT